MSKKCINCGASTSTKADECEYCGSPQYLSLAHKSSFFSQEIKDSIFHNLQNEDNNDFDDKLSLIILYLLNDLESEVEGLLNELSIKYPKSGRLLFIKAVKDLKLSGIDNASPSEIKNITSNFNLALSFDNEIAAEVKAVLLIIQQSYYEYNSINIPEKFIALINNLIDIDVPEDCLAFEIFKDI